jgi:hypothetical protein
VRDARPEALRRAGAVDGVLGVVAGGEPARTDPMDSGDAISAAAGEATIA